MKPATYGQFREFFGKLLVKLNDEKVILINKTKIQNAINSLSSTDDDIVVDSLIRFINNDCRVQIIGNHEIDTSRTPNLPFDGVTIEEHQKSGKMILDLSKINLYLSEEQKTGSIGGYKLRKELKGKKVMNACVLDYLLDNPHLIPEEWKSRAVFFWGTIFRDSDDGLCVRYLVWRNGEWQAHCGWIEHDFDGSGPAAVFAS
jgi:hypothetical protein